MADVFISYSHKDFKIAQTLADRLEVLGVEAWWDASLNGADNFTEEIQKQLVDAKAVIVIWSPHSITSTYVRKEASIALRSKKLIATRTVNLDYTALPDGFREQHTDLVEDLKQIEAALRKLGVSPPGYRTPKQRTEHPQVRDARLEIIEWKAQMDARVRDHTKELAEAEAQLAQLHSDQATPLRTQIEKKIAKMKSEPRGDNEFIGASGRDRSKITQGPARDLWWALAIGDAPMPAGVTSSLGT